MVKRRAATQKTLQVSDAKRPKKKPIRPSGLELLDSEGSTPSNKKRRLNAAASPERQQERHSVGIHPVLHLDILFAFAVYLYPMDLLNLARTSKYLRGIFLSKSSAKIWKSAQLNKVGLPECPADLSEPEYANLLFGIGCYGCGRRLKTTFWKLRRRYCEGCTFKWLLPVSSTACPYVIRSSNVIAVEFIPARGENCVISEQAESFMDEYERAFDKRQFISDRKKQCSAIREHASLCERWLQFDRSERAEERVDSILARLKKHGYEREVAYFGRYQIKGWHPTFKASTPLNDEEWSSIWPELQGIMEKYKIQRLEEAVYRPRRELLAKEFAHYVANPPESVLSFDLLPHVVDIAHFPPFRDILGAPEETENIAEALEDAFAQLPMLIENWKKDFDAQLAAMVKIPPLSTFTGASKKKRFTASGGAPGLASFQAPTDKLRLACAVFSVDQNAVIHPEVLSCIPPHHSDRSDLENMKNVHQEGAVPFKKRYDVKFLLDAPHLVHACGLDPHVATAEDMDRRNARFQCLSCKRSEPLVWNWRDALQHAAMRHTESSNQKPQWKVISDTHIDAVRAAEESNLEPQWCRRCLLCHPALGDLISTHDIDKHLVSLHNMELEDIQEGVHYTELRRFHTRSSVVMAEEEDGQVTFSKPQPPKDEIYMRARYY